MATGQDRPLEDEQTYFIRGMSVLEVCVTVLWDGVERSKVDLVEWWEKHIKTLEGKKRDPKDELKPWQVQSIATISCKEWDISVLSYAIRNCNDLEKHEDLRECAKKLNNVRSDCLCHERKAKIAFDKYVYILQKSMKCYKRLIAEKEAYMEYVKQLENITKYRIRDEETERWMTLLRSRDEHMRFGLTEEELRDIHAEFVGKVKDSVEEMKQGVTVEQQQQQTQQQNMQATNIAGLTLIQNFYGGTEAQASNPLKAGVHASGTDDASTASVMPKGETKPLGAIPTSQSNPLNFISEVNNYCQKHSLELPKYAEQRVGEQEFICTATFQGETFKGPTKSSTRSAKRATAEMVWQSLPNNV